MGFASQPVSELSGSRMIFDVHVLRRAITLNFGEFSDVNSDVNLVVSICFVSCRLALPPGVQMSYVMTYDVRNPPYTSEGAMHSMSPAKVSY